MKLHRGSSFQMPKISVKFE